MSRRRSEARSRPLTLLLAGSLLVTGCGLGERPMVQRIPTAAGTMTGDAAIDGVLVRLDAVGAAVFTAEYTALLAYGGTSSSLTVTQDGRDRSAVRRSVTIGDVRYITTPAGSSTCSLATSDCVDSIDAALVSNTGVTPEFVFGDMAKRLRRDALARIGATTASTRVLAGATATCVDIPVSGGTKQYCAFDDGVLARFVGGDVTIELTRYAATVDESLFDQPIDTRS